MFILPKPVEEGNKEGSRTALKGPRLLKLLPTCLKEVGILLSVGRLTIPPISYETDRKKREGDRCVTKKKCLLSRPFGRKQRRSGG